MSGRVDVTHVVKVPLLLLLLLLMYVHAATRMLSWTVVLTDDSDTYQALLLLA